MRRLAPVLRRADVDIAAIVAALPAQDQARIARVQDRAIPLLYEEPVEARFNIEPKTGSLVSVPRDRSTVRVRPSPQAPEPIVAILARSRDRHAVASELPKPQAASTTAQPVFAVDDRQTPASIKSIRDEVGSAVLMVAVAKLWLPLGLLIVGLGLVAAGLRRRHSA